MAGAEQMSNQLNVLVVDDSAEMRELLVAIVHREGHMAIPVDSAEKALELLPIWTFQVAFLDHNLPGIEGLLLGEYLRRSNPSMLIALVTGEDDPRLERRSRELSVTFIAKPFQNTEIHRVLESYTELARERVEERRAAADQDFEPPFARFIEDLPGSFDMPSMPGRIADRLITTLKRCLANLRSESRYSERDRVVALSALLASRVLDVDLPHTSKGLTLFEEYDRLMALHGRRTEFSAE